jgi:quinoprotein glucose dehydrogenase
MLTIVTRGNLVFVAASLDGHVKAFDKRTGVLLWEFQLPAEGWKVKNDAG